MPIHRMVVLGIATIALIMDLKYFRVSNEWILLSIFLGTIMNVAQSGFAGLLQSLQGFFVPVLILFGLFYFHMIGTGDIKLFGAIGIFIGPVRILYCMVYAFLFGAMLSAVILLYTGNLYERMRYLFRYIMHVYRTKEVKPYMKKGIQRPENFHFTVPILMSVMLYTGGFY